MVRADAAGIAGLLAQLHRPFARDDGVLELIDEVALGGHRLEDLGLLRRPDRRALVQRDPVERRGLRVRTGARRRPRRLDGVAEDSIAVAGADRVVHEHGGIGGSRSLDRHDHALVDGCVRARRHGGGDRQAAQVVTERDTARPSADEPGSVQGSQRQRGRCRDSPADGRGSPPARRPGGAGGPRRRRRAGSSSTGSRRAPMSGRSSPEWASISPTKNGFPPVSCSMRRGSTGRSSIIVAIAATDSGCNRIVIACGDRATSPSSARIGWLTSSSSSRTVPTSSVRVEPTRRSRNRNRSTVPWSAQWRSSTTSTEGWLHRCSWTAVKISCGWPASRSASRAASSNSLATSCSGPSGRGVDSGSHAPHRTGASSAHCCGEQLHERCLAGARLARDDDEAAVAGAGAIPLRLESGPFVVALEQRHVVDRSEIVPCACGGEPTRADLQANEPCAGRADRPAQGG